MKRRLGRENTTRWDSDELEVELPDQETISPDNKTVSVSFTRYNNLGKMMSDKHTGANIRYRISASQKISLISSRVS